MLPSASFPACGQAESAQRAGTGLASMISAIAERQTEPDFTELGLHVGQDNQALEGHTK